MVAVNGLWYGLRNTVQGPVLEASTTVLKPAPTNKVEDARQFLCQLWPFDTIKTDSPLVQMEPNNWSGRDLSKTLSLVKVMLRPCLSQPRG